MPQLGEIRRAREVNKKGSHEYIWVACRDCGKERWVTLSYGKPISDRCLSCGCKKAFKKGKLHHVWKGGRYKNNNGYILIWIPDDSPFISMRIDKCYIPEHRLVMAQYLGRPLKSYEVVHHRNGIRDDNRVENLQLIKGGSAQAKHQSLTLYDYRVTQLEDKVEELQKENRLLKWQIKELNDKIKVAFGK